MTAAEKLRADLTAAHSELTAAALAGGDTATIRRRIADLHEQIDAAERQAQTEADKASAARTQAFRKQVDRLIEGVRGDIEKKLAALEPPAAPKGN
jgi:hypothetical protein